MTALLENPTARVKWLAAPSSASWLEQANARPDLVLIDHAHCERKAAGVALQLMFRYPSDEGLGAVLSPLAREELEHFELVLGLLQRRGMALRPLPAPGYGATLTAAVRKGEPERMMEIRQELKAMNEDFDAGKAQQLADELGAIASRMAYRMASAPAEIYALLEPEQREELAALEERRERRIEKRVKKYKD